MIEGKTASPVLQDAGHAQRHRGLDMLRIVSTFLIVLLHVIGQGGILRHAAALSSYSEVGWLLECAAYCAVNCYALLSGYLLCRSRCGMARLLETWMQVCVIGVSLTLAALLLGAPVTRRELVAAFFPVCTLQYWYVTAYMGVYLLAPFLNRMIDALDKMLHGRLVMVLFLLLSLLPTLFSRDIFQTAGGYSLIWLAALYVAGAYLRLHVPSGRRKALVYLLGYAGFVFLTYGIRWAVQSVNLARYGALGDLTPWLSYPSPLVAGQAVCLFLACRECTFKGTLVGKGVDVFAARSFGVYLIHAHPMVFNLLLLNAFVPCLALPLPLFAGALLLAALCICLVCAALDGVRHRVFRLLGLDRLAAWLGERIDRLLGRA